MTGRWRWPARSAGIDAWGNPFTQWTAWAAGYWISVRICVPSGAMHVELSVRSTRRREAAALMRVEEQHA
jgi:hypothetical protein